MSENKAAAVRALLELGQEIADLRAEIERLRGIMATCENCGPDAMTTDQPTVKSESP